MRGAEVRPQVRSRVPSYVQEHDFGLASDGQIVVFNFADSGISNSVVDARQPKRASRFLAVPMAAFLAVAACVPGAAARPGAGVEPTPLPPGFIPADPPPQGVHPRVEQVAPEATATTPNPPEVKTQPCAILPPDSCSQARERKPVMINGVEYTYIVFTNSSEEKVPVFVPEDGTFLNKATDSGAPFSGVRATVRLPTGVYDIRGAVTVPDMIQVKDPKQGMVIGYVLPDKTIYISKTKGTPEGPRTDEDALRELFPEAYKNQPLTAYSGPVKPTVANYYDSLPEEFVK